MVHSLVVRESYYSFEGEYAFIHVYVWLFSNWNRSVSEKYVLSMRFQLKHANEYGEQPRVPRWLRMFKCIFRKYNDKWYSLIVNNTALIKNDHLLW